jgi:hypothetical protein
MFLCNSFRLGVRRATARALTSSHMKTCWPNLVLLHLTQFHSRHLASSGFQASLSITFYQVSNTTNPQSPNVSLLPRYSAAPPPPSSHNLNSNHNVLLNGMPNHKVFSLSPRPCLHHLCILESLHPQLQPIRNPLCL